MVGENHSLTQQGIHSEVRQEGEPAGRGQETSIKGLGDSGIVKDEEGFGESVTDPALGERR